MGSLQSADLNSKTARASGLLRESVSAAVRLSNRLAVEQGEAPHPRTKLKEIILERCVFLGSDRWLASSSGGSYDWLLDLRHALLSGEALNIISDLFWDKCASLLPFQVGGLEVAAVPIVAAIITSGRKRGYDVNGFIVRKERKPTGQGKKLEGTIGPEPIMVVDDLINAGGSVEKVRVALAELGRKIEHLFVLIDYESPRGIDWRTRHNLEAFSLFKLAEFSLPKPKPSPPFDFHFENLWNFSAPKPNHAHVVPKSAPVVYKDKVIFGSDAGSAFALEVSTGNPIWQYDTYDPVRKGIWARLSVANDRCYFGAYDGNLYCLEADTGRRVWRNNVSDWVGSTAAVSSEDDALWVGLEHQRPNSQGSIASFRLSSGEKMWEYWIPPFVHGSPAYSSKHGLVVVGANDWCVYALNAFSGTLRWKFTTNGPVKDSVIFDDARGLIYLGGFDGKIRALDIDTGKQAWVIDTDNIIFSAPLLHKDKLYVSSTDKYLHVVDLNATSHSRIKLDSKSVCSPVLLKTNIFLGTNGGSIFELDPDDCRILGRHQLPDCVTNKLAYCSATDTYFALTYTNQIFAFRHA